MISRERGLNPAARAPAQARGSSTTVDTQIVELAGAFVLCVVEFAGIERCCCLLDVDIDDCVCTVVELRIESEGIPERAPIGCVAGCVRAGEEVVTNDRSQFRGRQFAGRSGVSGTRGERGRRPTSTPWLGLGHMCSFPLERRGRLSLVARDVCSVFVSLEQDTSVCSFGRVVNLPPGAPAVPGTGCAGDISACQVLFFVGVSE